MDQNRLYNVFRSINILDNAAIIMKQSEFEHFKFQQQVPQVIVYI